MIDQRKTKSDLEIAVEIAQAYINRAKDQGISDIIVINKDRSVYLNTPAEKLEEFAQRTGSKLTVVMANGKLVNEQTEEESPIEEKKVRKPKK